VDGLAEQGFEADSVAAATIVVAVFNYLTRVADATGIEFDYLSPLPEFKPDRAQEPAARPAPGQWPLVTGPERTATPFPGVNEAWQRWHDHVFDAGEPLTRRERSLLAAAAARECCDRWRADELAGCEPAGEAERALVAFASKLSLRPWQMGPVDLDALRALGFAERTLLHAIAVVALQNAESRLAMGLAAAGGGSRSTRM
jgi:alkylhydroperoxidase/carboxymuconolactone decarboxylase family protein YurZ